MSCNVFKDPCSNGNEEAQCREGPAVLRKADMSSGTVRRRQMC